MITGTLTSLRTDNEDTEGLDCFCGKGANSQEKCHRWILDRMRMKALEKNIQMPCLYLQRSDSYRQYFPCDILWKWKLDLEEG